MIFHTVHITAVCAETLSNDYCFLCILDGWNTAIRTTIKLKRWTSTSKWYQYLMLNMSQFTNSGNQCKFQSLQRVHGERNRLSLKRSQPWGDPTIARGTAPIDHPQRLTRRDRGRATQNQVGGRGRGGVLWFILSCCTCFNSIPYRSSHSNALCVSDRI